MRKIFVVMLLAASPVLAHAAGKSASATMQVSFTVTESCTVQSSGPVARISCSAETPYQLQQNPAAMAAAPETGKSASRVETTPAEPTTVYF